MNDNDIILLFGDLLERMVEGGDSPERAIERAQDLLEIAAEELWEAAP